MWILHLLPTSVIQVIVHTILLAGIIGCFLSFFIINRILCLFPPLAGYHKLLQIISAALLISGIYLQGGYSTELQWRERVKEVEAKVGAAEAKASEANAALAKKSEVKVKVIRQKALVVKQYIDREVIKYDTACIIPSPVIKAHNAAAKNEILK